MTKLLVLLCLLLVGRCAFAQSTGTVTYIYTDPQGTPLAEADASGNITATFDYTPYGTIALGTPPNVLGYTGHVNDPETNLVYMQARYYDPAIGRFLSTDPISPTPGVQSNFNRYVYSDNDPIGYMDPTGDYAQNLTSQQIECEVYGGSNCGTQAPTHKNSNNTAPAPSSSHTSGWQWFLIGASNKLCEIGIQSSCTESDYVSAPTPSSGKEAGLVTAGGLMAAATMAVISDGESIELTAGHMGIVGDVQELRGSMSMKSGTMTVRVDMIRGNIKNPLSVINNLKTLASNSGAQTLRIEGTIANPGLYKVLSQRYGLKSEGATDSITIKVH
jgi:RHS repeat-associated protein